VYRLLIHLALVFSPIWHVPRRGQESQGELPGRAAMQAGRTVTQSDRWAPGPSDPGCEVSGSWRALRCPGWLGDCCWVCRRWPGGVVDRAAGRRRLSGADY